jgi:hypothetical protein
MLSIPQKCPFCAGVKVTILEVDTGAWAVSCQECHAIGPTIQGTPESAIDSWNMRLVLAANLGLISFSKQRA